MPTIISSADFRNNYAEISEKCHQTGEPVFVTKNGKGDVAVLSMDAYDRLVGIARSRERVLLGVKEASSGEVVSYEETMELARKAIE